MDKDHKAGVCSKATELAEGEITCSVYSSFEEVAGIRVEWDDFVESVGGDIYLTFDWCRIWWRYYGDSRKLRLFVFRKGDVIVGIGPFFIERIGWKPVGLQMAKMVGADFTVVILVPPFCQEYSHKIISYVNEQLFCSDRCDAVCWGPLSGIHPSAKEIEEHFRDSENSYTIVKKIFLGNYTLFDVPNTFEEYFASLSKSTRKHYRRGYEDLTAQYKVNFSLVENLAEDFPEFIEMHESQWRAVNKLGHFSDWPGARDFHTDLVKTHSQLGRLRLFCLYADDNPIVYRYVYRFGKRYYSFLPARICGAEWDKLGLGQMSHIMTVEKAAEEAVCEIDAGRGHYQHKLNLGGKEYPVVSFLVSNRSFRCIVRARLFSLFSGMLHFLYYRVWFNRLAPKLPFKRWPLWKLWVRTRL
jgi:CelD/BcsL family acetyltransferase involved in cellulose biosynthesis